MVAEHFSLQARLMTGTFFEIQLKLAMFSQHENELLEQKWGRAQELKANVWYCCNNSKATWCAWLEIRDCVIIV